MHMWLLGQGFESLNMCVFHPAVVVEYFHTVAFEIQIIKSCPLSHAASPLLRAYGASCQGTVRNAGSGALAADYPGRGVVEESVKKSEGDQSSPWHETIISSEGTIRQKQRPKTAAVPHLLELRCCWCYRPFGKDR